MADISTGLSNEAHVAGKTLTVAGDAFLNELSNDAHDGSLVRTVGISIPIGLGTDLALARSPTTFKGLVVVAGLVLGARELYNEGGNAIRFLSNAWNANSEEEQQKLALSGGTELGRQTLTFAEGSVGLGIGGLGSRIALAYSPELSQFSHSVTSHLDYAVRSTVPEDWWFSRAMGGRALGENYVNSDGLVNGINLVRDGRRFDGVESMQIVDPARRRATAWVPGTPRSAYIFDQQEPGLVSLHTQRSRIPSFNDLHSNDGVNVIVTDKGMTIFGGRKQEWLAAREKAEDLLKLPVPTSRTSSVDSVARSLVDPRHDILTVDFTTETAAIERLTLVQRNGAGPSSYGVRVPVDYQAAVRSASLLDGLDRHMSFLRDLETGTAPNMAKPRTVVGTVGTNG